MAPIMLEKVDELSIIGEAFLHRKNRSIG